MTTFRIAASAAAILALSATGAFAHAKLVSSNPPAKSSIKSPAKLELRFSEALNGALSGADISSTKMAMGGKMEEHAMKMDATSALGPKDKKMMVVTPKAPLPAGEYKVEWHAVSDDSHRTTGSFVFSVK